MKQLLRYLGPQSPYPALAGFLTVLLFILGSVIVAPPIVLVIAWWWKLWLP